MHLDKFTLEIEISLSNELSDYEDSTENKLLSKLQKFYCHLKFVPAIRSLTD